MAVSGHYPMMVRERRFHFLFSAATRLRRATLVTAPFGRLMGNRWTTNENLGMGHAVQRTDPRCENQPVSPEDAEAPKQLSQIAKRPG